MNCNHGLQGRIIICLRKKAAFCSAPTPKSSFDESEAVWMVGKHISLNLSISLDKLILFQTFLLMSSNHHVKMHQIKAWYSLILPFIAYWSKHHIMLCLLMMALRIFPWPFFPGLDLFFSSVFLARNCNHAVDPVWEMHFRFWQSSLPFKALFVWLAVTSAHMEKILPCKILQNQIQPFMQHLLKKTKNLAIDFYTHLLKIFLRNLLNDSMNSQFPFCHGTDKLLLIFCKTRESRKWSFKSLV